MGSFNMSGFYSHIPITPGDKVVIFICADRTSSFTDSGFIYDITNSGRFTPIALPFFGEYKDSAVITNFVEDCNFKLFEEVSGKPFAEFAEILTDLSGYTIKNMMEMLNDMKVNGDKNKYHHMTIKDVEYLIEFMKKIIHPRVYDFLEEEDRIRYYEVRQFEATKLTLIMEHKSIYDKMVELGSDKNIFSWGWLENGYTYENKFDTTADYINKVRSIVTGNLYTGINFMTGNEFVYRGYRLAANSIGDNPPESVITELYEINDKLRRLDYSVEKMIFNDTSMQCCVTHDMSDFALYNGYRGDITPFKGLVLDFLKFRDAFLALNAYFCRSSYAGQDEELDVMIPIYEEQLKILKDKKAEYDKLAKENY